MASCEVARLTRVDFGQDQMLERRLVAGAVAYSAMFLDQEVQVDLKAATVMLGLKEKLEKKWKKSLAVLWIFQCPSLPPMMTILKQSRA